MSGARRLEIVQRRAPNIDREGNAAWPVALVAMPFAGWTRPSIQIGLLKAIARTWGFPCSTFHLFLDFAKQIGLDAYKTLSEHRGRLYGEWLFSEEAFPGEAPPPELFLQDFAAGIRDLNLGGVPLETLRQEHVPRFLDALVDSTDWGAFRVVGFTSTFQQTTPSIALARRLKKKWPKIITVFGGANFDDEMGLELARIEPIDYIISGEADRAWPELLQTLARGSDPSSIAGVVLRENEAIRSTAPAPVDTLDDLPTPDYEEYFERGEALGILSAAARHTAYVPFESARGCWWGEKHHCTFCGLNGKTMTFRAKSPQRVLAELGELAVRHHAYRFEAVDNIIDTSFFDSFLPALQESGWDFQLFYEVKSNLTREKLRLLSHAGVRDIQPGIESLSSDVLKRMRKGVTAIQNVNTLRWGLYYNINIGWNVLWGFPGETIAEVERQAALFRAVRHLQPPRSAGRVWMERFSPIYQDETTFPAVFRRPEPSYKHVFPRRLDPGRLAYFFEYELENTLPPTSYDVLSTGVQDWQAHWKKPTRPTLTFWTGPGIVQIEDFRAAETEGTFTFEGALAELYRACSDRPRTSERLKQELQLPWSTDEIQDALIKFTEHDLMMRDGDQFLSLALPATRGR